MRRLRLGKSLIEFAEKNNVLIFFWHDRLLMELAGANDCGFSSAFAVDSSGGEAQL
jgi:hypothetical protein